MNILELYYRYLANPTKDNLKVLSNAYYAIPENNRRYCMCDQDCKDFKIKEILALSDDEKSKWRLFQLRYENFSFFDRTVKIDLTNLISPNRLINRGI